MKVPVVILFLLLLCSPDMVSQDCDCQDEFVQVCYYSAEDLCPPAGDCRYTLDGEFMQNGLRQKLLNPNLFGPNGIVNCPIQLQKIKDVSSIEYLEDQKCDIIFIGVFSVSHFEPMTDIPESELLTIKDWSIKCEKNLVIVSQYEASPWGYTMTNENLNPNTPDALNSTSSIFNGPFGMVSSFQQSGTYQGVITGTPTTSFDVLGRDANNKPTVVLDKETNDIILGDISILTQFGNLVLSPGPDIIVENDILAGNLFALGCGITDGTFTTSLNVNLCSDETHTLPNGDIVSDPGLYVDSLITSGNCDSLVFTLIEQNEDSNSAITYSGCKGDDYTIQIGSVVYNENNPIGTQTIQNTNGCDSVVEVILDFVEQDTSYIYHELCVGEEIQIGNQFYSGNLNDEIIVPVDNGCDSVVYLEILTHNETEYAIPTELIVDVNSPFQFPFYYPDANDISYEPSEVFSCQNCAEPFLLKGFTPETIDVLISDQNYCEYHFSINLVYTCTPHFANIVNLNSTIEANRFFGAISSCPLNDFHIEIYNRWGNIVHTSNDYQSRWDGYLGNTQVSSGVYVYRISYSILTETRTEFGTVTVLN